MAKKQPFVPFDGSDPVKAKIRQRRAQMLVHSCLYYAMDETVVDDHTWQRWANELATLQQEYPEFMNIGFYDKHFVDWDGTTGNHLPHRDPWVRMKAEYILERYNAEKALESYERKQNEKRTAGTN